MMEKASVTALMSCFGRAYHAENSENPIFDDACAKRLMTDSEYAQIAGYLEGGAAFFFPGETLGTDALRRTVNTQIAPTPLARARWCEDSLKKAAASNTSQYVILGAGMDTFAYREPSLMSSLKVFEVDHPKTQEAKRERTERAGLKKSDSLVYVPADLSVDDLAAKLTEYGFDTSAKTFFSWLGVTYYLSEEQIRRTLAAIASVAAEGSELLFDYADEGLFDSKIRRVSNMLAMAAAGNEPMKTCYTKAALVHTLNENGFELRALLDADHIQERYFKDRTDGLCAFEHICFAEAAVAKGSVDRD